MKLITAIIKPFRLENVREALVEAGFPALTASDVRGFGHQKGQTEIYRGAEYHVNFVAKTRIDLAVADERVDEAVEVIVQAARTGKIGDGKVFVSPLERVVRIRTGESGDIAL
ncbi:P-II family nitrogen regulator [Oecophyllibacter saccharovorans]|uniref:Nitrogen regulatory protein P-II n=1 Tax=Oecophyllibacter saccharovorans TaxID=2558360 RepID=A0A506URK5_9PROT|nr:P-II family nitrogen regulator [Oecophyllibacter saccharovorans]QDH14844.1 P-II family nitrogen regulator [Oecophyllibacter saccharovorans]TPW35985.1 P-II family nitrogen regulator [Oecophyllibacter saccharovorans]